ncbi:MAG: hypothetical protein ACE5JR_06595 [Gemmatimonadota bacterium]
MAAQGGITEWAVQRIIAELPPTVPGNGSPARATYPAELAARRAVQFGQGGQLAD